jgi:hypothetical protein
VLKDPSNIHKAVALTAEQFHYAFTNTISDADSKAAYERYAVPGPGRVLFQGALANFNLTRRFRSTSSERTGLHCYSSPGVPTTWFRQ